MSKKEVINGYNVLWTRETEVYRDKPVAIKDIYNTHLWFHHDGYGFRIKKNHTDLNEPELEEISRLHN